MRKDEKIGVRVPAELKHQLLSIAHHEGRTMAQICEILLKAGVLEYQKRGTKFLQLFVSSDQK
jgi:hypothetical protein